MLKENIKDAGEIVNNILTQTLMIPGIQEPISLLAAAKNFNEKDPAASEISKILYTFLQNPEATQNLLIEMKHLSRDLETR